MTAQQTAHMFVQDDTVPADTHGRRWCRCGLPEWHESHTLPPVDDERQAAEQRRIGERGDTP